MEIDLDIDGLLEGLESIGAELDAAATQAMATSIELTAAKARELAPKKTSFLANSINTLPVSGSFVNGTLLGVVVAGAPHALPQEEGAKPHAIVARYRRALRFPGASGFRFARSVKHPGNRAQPFMGPALAMTADDVAAEFAAAIEIALRRSGF